MNITEYKNNIDALKMFDEMEVYRWMISLGEKLQEDPLSEEKRIDAKHWNIIETPSSQGVEVNVYSVGRQRRQKDE